MGPSAMNLIRVQRRHTCGVVTVFIFILLLLRFLPWKGIHEHYILTSIYYMRTPVALPRENCTQSLQIIRHLQESVSRIQATASMSKVIHQTWKVAKLPQRYETWRESWKKCYPTWTHILWSDSDNRCLVQELFPWFLAHYDSLPANIYRVDSVRYLYLLAFGGIYADLDAECLRPFDHLLTQEFQVAFGSMDKAFYSGDYIQNSFMISRAPNHSLWRQAMDSITKKRHIGRPETMTGPHMLMEVIQEYTSTHESDNDIRIFPSQYFNPFSWSNNRYPNDCKDLNQMSDEEIIKCRSHFLNTSYVIQYHTQSWFKGYI